MNAPAATPDAIVRPDTKWRFSLGRHLPKVARYALYHNDDESITIVPIIEEARNA